MFIYGGTDINNKDSAVNEMWYLDPLLTVKPVWNRIDIIDSNFILPDGIKGHKLAIRVINES